MRIAPRSFVGAILLVSLVSWGCGQRVNSENTLEMEPGDVNVPFIVDAPSRDQEVTVTVKPETDAPVDVFILVDSERPNAMDELGKNRPPKNTLKSQQKVDKETVLTATIPAKNKYAVIVRNTKKSTKVGIKLEGR